MSTSNSRIRVLVADEHPLYREGVARLARQHPAFELVAEAADVRTALVSIERYRPDVAVIDPAMLRLAAGANALRALALRDSPTRVVLVASSTRPDALESFEEGAIGYLTKRATAAELEAAIRRAARGEATIAPEFQTRLATELRRRGHGSTPGLSVRERQVLGHTAAGLTARQIAAELIVTVSTVRTHQRRVCDKLGVPSQAAAVAAAMRLGLLD